ncbi:hypothetical protein [Asaia prunellae]|uniref:hypothetical protein n=1 Tax=Asaia prunellae TaxID=610245 RepID=UPI000A831E15|nr:hypothetical protein [Asaia prunellae]
MSNAINQYGGSALSLILEAGVRTLSAQQEAATWQSSTGVVGATYADLGASRATVLNLTPKITQVQSWQSNISAGQTTLSVTATALNQFVAEAQSLATNLLGVSGTATTSQVAAAASSAQSALESMKTLLNTSDGTNYVFAGTDTTTAPIKGQGSLSTSTLAQQIAEGVKTLDGTNASTLLTHLTTSRDQTIHLSPFFGYARSPGFPRSGQAAFDYERGKYIHDARSCCYAIVIDIIGIPDLDRVAHTRSHA